MNFESTFLVQVESVCVREREFSFGLILSEPDSFWSESHNFYFLLLPE